MTRHGREGGVGSGSFQTPARGESTAAPGRSTLVTHDDLATEAVEKKGSGSPIDPAIRAPVEAALGVDLGHARVHTDQLSAQYAGAIGARAFAHGPDIFLGEGESETDAALIAHELTHVAQQSPRARMKLTVGGADAPGEVEADAIAAKVTSGASTAKPMLIVDGTPTSSAQLSKVDFLDHLEREVILAAIHELGMLGGGASCPYIVAAFAKYRAQPAASAQALILRWIPAAASVTTAGALIPLVVERMRAGVKQWQLSKELPPELAAADPQLAAQAQATAVPKDAVQKQSLDGLESDLGSGTAVDANTAQRMSAHGVETSSAKIHEGPVAQAKAAEAGATAFAVGNNVVMGANAPVPGSALGDALLAHELAHVAQQKDAASDPAARKKPIGDEDQLAEGDANRAVEGAAKGKASWDSVMRTGLQLQRCAEPPKQPTTLPPVKQIATPPPQMMKCAGDWFQLRWDDDGFSALVITYEGPLPTGPGGKTMSLRIDYDRTRLLQPKVTAVADDHVVYDLFGDNSQRIIVTAKGIPYGPNERDIEFSASINGAPPNEHGKRSFALMLPEPGKPTPAGLTPELAKREAPVTKTLVLGSDAFLVTARKFGDTNQVQFAITGQSRNDPKALGQPVDLSYDLLSVAKMPEQLALDIDNKGRDLFIDFGGDKKHDMHVSHTMLVEPWNPMDGKGERQKRTHVMRLFDQDGVFVREHRYEVWGETAQVPKGQDETKDAPALDVVWPNNRPPGQDDIPGQMPHMVDRAGGIAEMRIDGDGDRAKELMLRFKVAASKTDTPVDLEIVRLDGDRRDVATARFISKGIAGDPAMGASVSIIQVTDGHTPTVVGFAAIGALDGSKLEIAPPQQGADKWTYNVVVDGQTLTYAFPAPTTEQHSLVNGKPPDSVKDGNITHYDLPVGEYGDVFRFQLDRNANRATFTVRPLADGMGVGAWDLNLNTSAKKLVLAPGDKRAINFDLGGGPGDIVIWDRLDATNDPASQRSHVLSISGRAIGPEVQQRFEAIGVLRSGHAVDDPHDPRWDTSESITATMHAQADQGNFTTFASRIDTQIVKARKDALDKGVIGKPLFDAWQTLSLKLIELDGERAAVTKDPTKKVDEMHVKAAADAAKNAQDALENESKDAASKDHGRPANQFTKRAVWNNTDGSGFDLQTHLVAHQWAKAESDYTAFVDGFDSWITHQLKDKVSEEASQQHEYLRNVSSEAHKIEKHSPIRIYGTFTPDEEKNQHVPLNLFVYKDTSEWHLVDLTNPKDPFDDTVGATTDKFPPAALFQKLNWKKHFPVGIVNYRLPEGRDGIVECTGKRKWYDWFSEIGLALAVVGIGALTMGAGTVAAVALAGAGVAGAIGAAGDLQDSLSHNHADAKTVILDVAQIVGGLAGAGQVLGGRLIKVAAAADEAVTAGVAGSSRMSGAWASLAGLAGRTYVPITLASGVSNGVTLAVMTADAIAAIASINANTTMGPDQRREAITKVVAQFLIVGGITFMAVKGDIATVLEGKPPIEIVNLNGEPVVVVAGTKPIIRPKIGDIIETDGSLTKTGRQRLAELPSDTRKRLLGLDQATMGKVLLLDEAAISTVSKLDDAAIKKLAHMHPLHAQALVKLPQADLAAVLALDDATIAKLSKMQPETVAGLAPITEAKVHQKIADVEAVDANVKTQLADVQGHLRDTDFGDRGGITNNGGNVKVMAPTRSGGMAPKAIDAAEYVRLEPIPSPPAPKAVTINSVEVTANLTAKEGGKEITGNLVSTPDGLPVPKPETVKKVVVKTSGGDHIYTTVEDTPPGTRIAISAKEMKKGVPGGHTRAAWDAATAKYGDAFTPTGEAKIGFKLPGSKSEIKMSAIDYSVTTTNKGVTTTVPNKDPKTIFENAADLGTFETHMRPYMSAKIEGLKGMRPADGAIIGFDVPVTNTAGMESSVRVEFPWRDSGPGTDPDLVTWWVGKSSFTKGSPLVP